MQKHVNLVDLVKSFSTDIFLQNLASIQKRTSPVKFAHLAEKSRKGSISNLSTKVGGHGMRTGPSRKFSLQQLISCVASLMSARKTRICNMLWQAILRIRGVSTAVVSGVFISVMTLCSSLRLFLTCFRQRNF